MITARKLNAFIKKHMPSPNRAIRNPLMVGPISLAILKRREFRAMALLKSSGFSTISITKDCLVGASTELRIPRIKLKSKRCHILIVFVRVKRERVKA
jgi:hypothetical protein